MERKRSIRERIVRGQVDRKDVVRRLAELAYGSANDCVRLVTEQVEDPEGLDLDLLSEVRRSDKGAVEVKLVDRIQVLKLLAEIAGEDSGEIEAFLTALQEDGE